METNDNHETDSEMCKYDTLSIKYFGRKYWELNADERVELIDLWNERNN